MDDDNDARIRPLEQQQQQQQEHLQVSSEELFSQGIADLFMAVEELRQQCLSKNSSSSCPCGGCDSVATGVGLHAANFVFAAAVV